MEEGFTLWEASSNVVQREEVICGIDNGCAIMQTDASETSFDEVCEEVVVQDDVASESIISETNQDENSPDGDNIMYLTEDNVLVMQPTAPPAGSYQDNFLECQVTEEVITDDWVNSQSGEERVEIPVGEVGAEQQIEYDDTEVPLPTDQDEYTASRPYPCDFCSRRFRKKANLMNHMVAHQTDRPHGCNLCGARYIRKCDLMNHLKIHAYVPDPDGLDDEEIAPITMELEMEKTKKSRKSSKKRKAAIANSSPPKTKIKQEHIEMEDRYEMPSRSYNYVEEDVRLLTEMENHVNSSRNNEYGSYAEVETSITEVRYPILDARKPFVCQHCGVAFAREKALASHARIHAGDSPFECETCNEMFWDVALLRDHVRTKHGGIAADSDYEDIDDDEYIDDSKYGDFYCKICGMRFHRTDLLRRHMRSHEEVKEEYAVESDYGHVCNVCGQSFTEALDLLAHAESHTRQLGHRCMLCGECFGDESVMANHVMQRHGKNMPPNTCMLCGKTCKDRRTLLKHSWDHSREKLFSCSKCGKSFHNKARLKRHMMSHRNKAVQCDICGDDFPDGRTLMNHRHSHSNISGRQFPCRECGKTFGSRSSQQIHIRIHTGERPYGCRFCWKAFADGGTLRKHERIHTGEKPYACAVCPRAFNQRVVLREHIRSHHSGPDSNYSNTMTPYCCTVCNDMFSTSQDLIVHLIHHCDLNTAMKRQPQVGPRKYKRRRKLKPHELEMISNRVDDEQDMYSDSDEKHRPRRQKKPKPVPQVKQQTTIEKDYESIFQSFESTIQNINSLVNTPKQANSRGRKKVKPQDAQVSVHSRPKMIHTQKTRVPIDPQGDGKGRHKTKTMITRTAPVEQPPKERSNSFSNERNRPRTKNVSYHILQAEKLPLATFGEDGEPEDPYNIPDLDQENTNPDIEDFDQVLIKPDPDSPNKHLVGQELEYQQVETEIPDVANEETVLVAEEIELESEPTPVAVVKVNNKNAKKNNSLTPGRHIIGPGNKVIRIVKGGMLISNNKVKRESETLLPDVKQIKQEFVEPSPLHELAEISMQHAQNQFRCEMCCATFSDRSQLLMHVPIHI